MRVIAGAALAGVVAGMGGMWLAFDRGWLDPPSDPRAARIIEEVPQLSLAEADAHRASRFERIRTIEDTLALPGDFAQTEALYALAGRSDSAAVQGLIFQADGIRDPSDRRAALSILFARLAELDTASALALARSEYFASEQAIESSVWMTWGELDLEAALRHAASLEVGARRKAAAEALLAAHGHWGNATTERIAQTLDFAPGANTQAYYLYQLADRRPADAIEYVKDLSDSARQHELASLLGQYLGKQEPQADRYAAMFDDEALRQSYRSSILREAAKADPVAVLDTLLANPSQPDRHSQLHHAMQVLAEQDIEQALSYLGQVGNRRDLQILSNAVVSRLARSDPERALAWARENDRSLDGDAYRQVLMTIAQDRPEFAMQEAQSITNVMHRHQATTMIAMTLSHRDPEKAIALLDQIPRNQERDSMTEMIVDNWVQRDPDAALSWLLESDAADNGAVMMRAVQALAQSDLDSAMRWLPRIGDRHQSAWRTAIAAHLAMQESPAAAESFIARFQHSPDYSQLVASAAAGIGKRDVEAAFRMGERISSDSERDSLYAQLIGHQAQQSPQQAAERLALITDPSRRSAATGQVASTWAQQDPAAAEHWVRRLATDAGRDQAIAGLMWSWDELTPSRRALIESITDREVRQQGLARYIWRVARSDVRRAESMLDEIDLTDDERTMLESRIGMVRNQGRYIHY